jgi:hypothetical protein
MLHGWRVCSAIASSGLTPLSEEEAWPGCIESGNGRFLSLGVAEELSQRDRAPAARRWARRGRAPLHVPLQAIGQASLASFCGLAQTSPQCPPHHAPPHHPLLSSPHYLSLITPTLRPQPAQPRASYASQLSRQSHLSPCKELASVRAAPHFQRPSAQRFSPTFVILRRDRAHHTPPLMSSACRVRSAKLLL